MTNLIDRLWRFYIIPLLTFVLAVTFAVCEATADHPWRRMMTLILTIMLVLVVFFVWCSWVWERACRKMEYAWTDHRRRVEDWKNRPVGADNLRAANATARRFGYRSKVYPPRQKDDSTPAA